MDFFYNHPRLSDALLILYFASIGGSLFVGIYAAQQQERASITSTIDLPPAEKLVGGDVSDYGVVSYKTRPMGANEAPEIWKLRKNFQNGKVVDVTIREHAPDEKK